MSTLKTKKTLSQCDRILQHLQSGKTITPAQAWDLFGCYRLGARIHDLRKQNFQIVTEIIYKNGGNFAEYSLRSNNERS
ncbi:helix-turn-helix domain-containing protein [Gilliamella sp. B3022]|uniref:helix-turn-helix domain-containing protein n=1 Tax=unclassified Gilliamella TaxID=2685620 RepID=UPI002269A69B|nr:MULTISPECIES: helix-turn-helix domain-containing protein [unclassified Gilliamella]MCX8656535.1 helix-turn-helix domain-containing protein [Gilliamella sp. B2894]MCX8693153.1 helix-turn-helix domain-containing protein [Gilliamella sp. B2881]WDM18442.1 helix-turn-helix domain-containing protein [Gilliamella sp. B3022]